MYISLHNGVRWSFLTHTPTFWRSKEGKACCSHALQCKQVTDEQHNISPRCSCCAFQGEQTRLKTEMLTVCECRRQASGSTCERKQEHGCCLGRLRMTFWLTPGGKFDYFLSVSAVSVFKCSIVLLWVTLQKQIKCQRWRHQGPRTE